MVDCINLYNVDFEPYISCVFEILYIPLFLTIVYLFNIGE